METLLFQNFVTSVQSHHQGRRTKKCLRMRLRHSHHQRGWSRFLGEVHGVPLAFAACPATTCDPVASMPCRPFTIL